VSFEFATPTRILFGEGRVREVGAIAVRMGRRALLVQGGGGRGAMLHALLADQGTAPLDLRVSGEPTTRVVEEGVERARRDGCDLVVAIGGGSVIDAGKAIAALLTNPGELRAYLEVIGEGRPLSVRAAPFIAVPTTAGSGAEVTRNAVLLAEEERLKVSLRSSLMLPAVALIDPELTYSLPPEVTASTGLDALTQCIEPFVTPQGNPLTDALAREGVRLAAGSLDRVFRDGSDREARRNMAAASLCGGLALANAKLGAVHGFAAPLGGLFPVPHGTVCARLLPHVVATNVAALRAREPDSSALDRYAEIAAVLTGNPHAAPEDAAVWLQELGERLAIPPLGGFGLSEGDIPEVVPLARQASSMKGNPLPLTDDELASILRAAL
jgi:alcohol dehydrogenase class IV